MFEFATGGILQGPENGYICILHASDNFFKTKELKMEQIKLNLGAGEKKLDGHINIDIDPGCKPDLVLDLSKNALPFKDNSVDEVVALHSWSIYRLGKPYLLLMKFGGY